jgi:hypothetical protein
MATLELTVEQILNVARKLPESQKRRLVRELGQFPRPRRSRDLIRHLRGAYRMPAQKKKRLSDLLAKGNSGTLSAAESGELDRLVTEFEEKTLDLARAAARSFQSLDPGRTAAH